MIFSTISVFALLLSVIACSLPSEKPSRKRGIDCISGEEETLNTFNYPQEYVKKAHEENSQDLNEIIELVDKINLSYLKENVEERTLAELEAKIPHMSDRNIYALVNSNVFFQNLKVLKLFHRLGRLKGKINFDDVAWVLYNKTPKSVQVAKFIFENELHVSQSINKSALKNLYQASASFHVDCFRIMAADFGFDSYSNGDIANFIILPALANGNYEVVKIVSLRIPNRFDNIVKEAISASTRSTDTKALRFFHNAEFSFSHLSDKEKHAGLITAARCCDLEMTREFFDPLKTYNDVPHSRYEEAPWIVAARGDCAEIVLFYIDMIKDIDVIAIMTKAIGCNSASVINALISEHKIGQPELLQIFKDSIDTRNSNSVRVLLNVGFEFKGKTVPSTTLRPLSYAVLNNHLEAVSLLLNNSADVNEINECKLRDDIKWHVTCLYFVKSREMIDLLRSKHVDLNFVFNGMKDNGEVVKWTTLLHILAQSGKIDLYTYLVALDVDRTILNDEGKTAEEILEEIDQLYS